VRNARKKKRKDPTTNNSNTITALNRRNDLRAFITNSTPGFQFSLIVLYSIARKYYSQGLHLRKKNNYSAFTFSSREFIDEYSRIACDLGLSAHLIREIAFPEYTLTLLYLGFIREKEDTGEYEFRLSLDESKWLGSIALNIMQGGIRSPVTHASGVNYGTSLTSNSNQDIERLVKEMTSDTSSSTSTSAYTYTSTSNRRKDKRDLDANIEKLVTPRSRNYGRERKLSPSYLADKQPPNTYMLRKNLGMAEAKRLQDNFFTDKTCVICGRNILFEDFDIWIGEPMKRTPSNVQDQRMSDILSDSTANPKREYTTSTDNNNNVVILNPEFHPTEREILELGYSILPMDGRNGFIAFAKPLYDCPTCGYNTWYSM
jgi:hypothetical protein